MTSKDESPRILFINPFGIGDVLFTTPAIRSIKEAFPKSFIGYWCNERVEAALKANPNIDTIFALSRGDLKKISQESKIKAAGTLFALLGKIRKECFDVSLDFSLDHRYSLVSKFVGIRKRIGFNYKTRGRFLTHKIDLEGYSDKHVVDYYLELLKFLDIKPSSRALELFVPEKDREEAGRLLASFGIEDSDLIIGIAPGAGASWGKDAAFKHWPAIKFARLADKVADTYKAKIVLLGSDAERPIADTIFGAMRNKPINLTGKTTLEEFSAVLSRLRLLVTNDGGPLHMATALGVKTVSIFGPVDERVYGPYPDSDKHLVVTNEIQCRPCYRKFRLPECVRDKVCINAVSIEDVYQSVRRLLA
jgi:lipopolysaccharide heptosyltransferase II